MARAGAKLCNEHLPAQDHQTKQQVKYPVVGEKPMVCGNRGGQASSNTGGDADEAQAKSAIAPLPAGFKMKSRWLIEYEREQRAQEAARFAQEELAPQAKDDRARADAALVPRQANEAQHKASVLQPKPEPETPPVTARCATAAAPGPGAAAAPVAAQPTAAQAQYQRQQQKVSEMAVRVKPHPGQEPLPESLLPPERASAGAAQHISQVAVTTAPAKQSGQSGAAEPRSVLQPLITTGPGIEAAAAAAATGLRLASQQQAADSSLPGECHLLCDKAALPGFAAALRCEQKELPGSKRRRAASSAPPSLPKAKRARREQELPQCATPEQEPTEPAEDHEQPGVAAVQAGASGQAAQTVDSVSPASGGDPKQHGSKATLECHLDGSAHRVQLGMLDLASFENYRELWSGIKAAHSGALQGFAEMKLVYQDQQGDWMQLRPDEPWPVFLSSAQRVLISGR